MSSHISAVNSEDLGCESFEEWAELVIENLWVLTDELRAEVQSLRRRVLRLEQSAGRGLIHPSDLLERSN